MSLVKLNGYIVKNGDGKVLSDYITQLKNDKETTSQLSVNARNIFLNKYSKEVCLMQYLGLIGRLLDTQNAA